VEAEGKQQRLRRMKVEVDAAGGMMMDDRNLILEQIKYLIFISRKLNGSE
jgi:hypothetical protein